MQTTRMSNAEIAALMQRICGHLKIPFSANRAFPCLADLDQEGPAVSELDKFRSLGKQFGVRFEQMSGSMRDLKQVVDDGGLILAGHQSPDDDNSADDLLILTTKSRNHFLVNQAGEEKTVSARWLQNNLQEDKNGHYQWSVIQPFAADMVEQLNGQLAELRIKEVTAVVKSEAYSQNVEGFSEARDFAISAAQEMISAAKAKLESKQKQVSAFDAKELQARLNYERQEALFQRGLKPAREIELLKREWDVAVADIESIKQDVAGLKNELTAKQKELEEKRHVAQTKIDYARAMQQDAIGSAATIRKEIRDVEMKLQEMDRLTITAPRDGTVFRLNVNERGDAVKEGDPLLTLIPEATQKAVELLIVGNDMPLIQIGQQVRLQFEGWPAVQLPGWPSVAVGTFCGTVATVDSTDDGRGSFRILITPKEDEQEWPSDRYLRQGVRANGWVMLRNVALGYEIWRQLNGFPVILSDEEPGKEEKSKVPKLPK